MGRSTLAARISSAVDGLGSGPIFVHSDVSKVMGAVPPSSDRKELLRRHIDFLCGLAGAPGPWFPTFNYAFATTRLYDVRETPSEVGALTEHARADWSAWRTAVPFFSVCGRGDRPPVADSGDIDPFDGDSVFAQLTARDGMILFYGARLDSATMIHHAERRSGGPLYRYDKIFSGTAIDEAGERRDIRVKYHVRPRGRDLEYDWARLEEDLDREGLLRGRVPGDPRILAMSAGAVAGYWTDRLKDEPLYLLDAASRDWVERDLDRLGRRFAIGDYEAT